MTGETRYEDALVITLGLAGEDGQIMTADMEVRTLKVVNEEVIAHTDTLEVRGRRAGKIEFRVIIDAEDDLGRRWTINKCYKAAPKLLRDKRGRG